MSSPKNPVTDLLLLHQRIVADLQQLYPSPWKILLYPRQDERMPVPCIGVQLTSFEPGDPFNSGDIGTQQFNSELRFEAYVFRDYKEADYRIKTRLYAVQLAAHLIGRRWSNVANGPCRVLGVYEDRWQDSGAAQYDCMRVEWAQTCLFNTDIFEGGIVPSEINFGFAPNVGPPHVDEYFKVL